MCHDGVATVNARLARGGEQRQTARSANLPSLTLCPHVGLLREHLAQPLGKSLGMGHVADMVTGKLNDSRAQALSHSRCTLVADVAPSGTSTTEHDARGRGQKCILIKPIALNC